MLTLEVKRKNCGKDPFVHTIFEDGVKIAYRYESREYKACVVTKNEHGISLSFYATSEGISMPSNAYGVAFQADQVEAIERERRIQIGRDLTAWMDDIDYDDPDFDGEALDMTIADAYMPGTIAAWDRLPAAARVNFLDFAGM